MKKICIALAASMAMIIAGCNKEQTNEQELQNEGTVVSFTATLPQFSDETKATVDNTSFTWADGDQISIPANNADGYIVFETKSAYLGTFKGTVPDGVSLVSGKAHYPASVSEGTYSTTFGSINDAKAGFKMEADYTVGAESLSFSHLSSMIHLTVQYIPSSATGLVVKEGSTQIASISLSNPNATEDFYVPITPNGSKQYSFALMEGANVLKQVSKTDALIAGTYYSTPLIKVYREIQVGVIYYIYESGSGNWNLPTGWNLYYYSRTDGDSHLELNDLNTTAIHYTSYFNSDQTFHMFNGQVPADVTKFKVYWTNGTNTDWYGNDNSDMSKLKAYVFEYGDGDDKKRADYDN